MEKYFDDYFRSETESKGQEESAEPSELTTEQSDSGEVAADTEVPEQETSETAEQDVEPTTDEADRNNDTDTESASVSEVADNEISNQQTISSIQNILRRLPIFGIF